MAFWNRKPALEERLVATLEKLTFLYQLDLASRGIITETGTEEGELLLTDAEDIARREYESELRKLYGLPESHDFRVPSPATPDQKGTWTPAEDPSGAGESLFGASWGFGTGPEAAEDTQPDIDALRGVELGPPSALSGQRDSQKPEGESRPNSGEEPERGAEEQRSPTSKTPRA